MQTGMSDLYVHDLCMQFREMFDVRGEVSSDVFQPCATSEMQVKVTVFVQKSRACQASFGYKTLLMSATER